MSKKLSHPLVYSCSGCSDVAQITNYIAIDLDRQGAAEMSCIAGVGGGVPGLVKVAKSGRQLVVLDGCAMECCKSCLAQQDLVPDLYVRFDKFGFKKRKGQCFDPADAERAREIVGERLQDMLSLAHGQVES